MSAMKDLYITLLERLEDLDPELVRWCEENNRLIDGLDILDFVKLEDEIKIKWLRRVNNYES